MEVNNIDKENWMINTEQGLKDYCERAVEFSDYSKIYGTILNKEQRRTEYLVYWLKPRKNEKLLDVGCGDGLQLEAFFNYNPDIKLYGIDISGKRIERAARRVRAVLTVGSAYNLPYADNEFDAAVCSEVLEHVPNPETIVAEMHRVLKINGKLVVSMPYRQQITYDICVHCGKPTPLSGHINSFDEKKLTLMLKNAGFKPLAVRGIVGSASLITPFRKIPFALWNQLDRFIRKIRHDDIFLIALAQKINDNKS